MRSVERKRGHHRLWTILIPCGLLLAGCSSSILPSVPTFDSINVFSSFKPKVTATTASGAPAPPPNFECPDVTIRECTSTLKISANPSDPSPLNVRYQVGVGQTARECRLVGDMLTIKVGIQGRVILGPAGGPGQIEVPIRFAVVQEGVQPKTIVTKLQRVPVVIPPGDGNLTFTHVEDNLTFPMPPGAAIDYYVIYVGFDAMAPAEPEKKKPQRRRNRSRDST